MKFKIQADEKGFFGEFGGRFVDEALVEVLNELEKEYKKVQEDEEFYADFKKLLRDYVGRPSPITFAKNLTEKCGGAKIYLKREDLNHTGAHKINNALGQALLAERMGKTKLVCETGAGSHGVACATAAALFGMEIIVFMGEEDIRRQEPNVFRMELLGAEIIPVTKGNGTLADAIDAALDYWVKNVEDTHYLLGSAVGPHPYPTIVRDFQSVIGEEIKEKLPNIEGKLPEALVACVGGGSNSIGTFYPLLDDEGVKMYGVEAGGEGENTLKNALSMLEGEPTILHGFKSYVIKDEKGNVRDAYSISAGLDYPGVGPEHCYLKDAGRIEYPNITDDEALDALVLLSREEGIIPALESSHAIAYALKLAKEMSEDEVIVVTLSGRGDKDMEAVRNYLKEK